jgi:hypothetical protein
MDMQTAVAIAGGTVGEANLPRMISLELFTILESWREAFQEHLDAIAKGARSGRVVIKFTRSPSLVARIRPLEDGSFVLLIPLGIIARTRLLASILLSYTPREFKGRYIASALDDRPESDWELPSRLVPLFGEILDDAVHWEQLESVAAEHTFDAKLESPVNEVAWVVLAFVLSHESAHVIRGHPTILRKLQENGASWALEEDALRRGLEVDADVLGVSIFLHFVDIALRAAKMVDYPSSLFRRCGFGVTLMLGMYDTRRKALSLYRDGRYPHPLVRHSIFMGTGTRFLATTNAKWADVWQEEERAGWAMCLEAFSQLDEDCFIGTYSDPSQVTWKCVPVTSLNDNVFDSTLLYEYQDKELALLAQVDVIRTQILEPKRRKRIFRPFR